jgi:hypothetical protein
MKKSYNLPNINKNLDIGDTILDIDESFISLEKFIKIEQEEANTLQDFIKNINVFYDDLEYACGVMEKRNSTFKETWEVILNEKDAWLKPIIVFYTEKILEDATKVSNEYINNLICDWMTINYPIKKDEKNAPLYIQGQTAIIYYIKGRQLITNPKMDTTRYINCVTQDTTITANCQSTRYGSACADGCGCIDCSGTAHCNVSKTIDCYFPDRGAKLDKVRRYLRAVTSYININNYETRIPYVKLIVDECQWKIASVSDIEGYVKNEIQTQDVKNIIPIEPVIPTQKASPVLPKKLKTLRITTNRSFKVPPEVTKLENVLLVGGGGGGGGEGQRSGGGGGGGGGILSITNYIVVPGNVISAVIGSGGKGGGNYAYGQDGGSTTFGLLKALGGKGGHSSTGGDLAGGLAGQGNSTGLGGQGQYSTVSSAVNGGGGFNYSITSENFGGGGGGGNDFKGVTVGGIGGGGAGGHSSYANNIPATLAKAGTINTGGGGGGAARDQNTGASGGSGIIIIQYYE